MLHVLAGDVPPPTDAELTAYFEQHRGRYARRPTVTVEDVMVEAPPQATLRPARLDDGAIEPPAGARRSVLSRVTEGELAWAFGDETAARVMDAPVGSWIGPHASATGDHWFRVLERSIGTDAPALDAIRDQVRYDWMAQAEDVLLQQRVAAIRGRYTVRVGAAGAGR
jgi:hypothetical protein